MLVKKTNWFYFQTFESCAVLSFDDQRLPVLKKCDLISLGSKRKFSAVNVHIITPPHPAACVEHLICSLLTVLVFLLVNI